MLVNTKTYAVARCDLSQRYFIFFLYFVFALAERKNEIQIHGKYKGACMRHHVSPDLQDR